MKKLGYDLSLILSALVLVVLVGCKQETPAEKAKAAAASGNAVSEAAGQAAVDAIKTPMDKARQAEGKLEKSAEQTAAEIKKSTQ
ncbi:MAG: hypothetical protein A3H49_09325 [Nitrospirae bacterium RIFCSPLOWO2_02_FULL_62_14]|nr:MAG: hypothetical protein A3H49_09325 [Nitrospirae bacterium RIFCSPLOWO2_02_FULL_62_14]OGW68221.1 MAG: hypothetical protein A3A88_08905 [Nitrospirae bacterium RIFCSPLOWO2_01_FULL_62_17]